MLIIVFMFLATFVVLFSVGVAYFAEKIEETTEMKNAVVGMVLLAFATSLPEFTTAIVTIQSGNSELLIANILGSNFFNLLIIVIMHILFWKKNILENVTKEYLLSFILLLLMHVIIMVGLVLNNHFSITTIIPSVLIFLVYVVTIKLSGGANNDTNTKQAPLKRRTIVFFVLFSLMLVIAATYFVRTVEELVVVYSISAMLAGTILIGLVTSLPELVSSITLVKRGQQNLFIEAIIGSNLINFLLLVIGEILLTNRSVFITPNANRFILYLIILSIATLLLMYSLFFKKKTKNMRIIQLVISISLFVLYVVTLFI